MEYTDVLISEEEWYYTNDVFGWLMNNVKPEDWENFTGPNDKIIIRFWDKEAALMFKLSH